MADLAVTAHRHSQVAFLARPNSGGAKADAAFAFSLEQLLQGGGVMLPHPSAADLLPVEPEPTDRGNPADEREADEIADLSRKRFQTRRPEIIDHRQDAAPPVPQETDHRRRTSADTDNAEHPGERTDRREAR